MCYSLPLDFIITLTCLAECLHKPTRRYSVPLFIGLLVANGKRKTVASWLKIVHAGTGFRKFYNALGSIGRVAGHIAARLLRIALKTIPLPSRLVFAIDDTPTKRYGPEVEGAGIHHNPTPGPAGVHYLYGHIWVTIASIAIRPLCGTICLPLYALMYIRQVTIDRMPSDKKVEFRTKIEQASELMRWASNAVAGLEIMWDEEDRRLTHAEKSKALREASLEEAYREAQGKGRKSRQLQRFVEEVIMLVA